MPLRRRLSRSSDARPTRRARLIARIERRLPWPRLQMMLLVALTGATGFLTSYAMLHAGVASMPIRYAAAVAFAYAAFLGLLWCWLRLRMDLGNGFDILDIGTNVDVTRSPSAATWVGGGGRSGGGGASAMFETAPQAGQAPAQAATIAARGGTSVDSMGLSLDADELVAVLVALVAVAGAAVAVVWIIWAAPALLAELTVDAAVSGGLYRRLKNVGGGHWLRTALRRTVLPFAGVGVLFVVAGVIIEYIAPEAVSMGDVFRQMAE